MYDPSIGRWMSEDPIGFGGGDDNTYRYVGNDPTDETDPTGLQAAPEAGQQLGRLLNSTIPVTPPQPGYNNATGLFYPKPVDPDEVKKWLGKGKVIVVETKEDFEKKIAGAAPGTTFKWVIVKGQLRAVNHTDDPRAVHPLLSVPPGGPVSTAGRFLIGKDGKVYFNNESHHYKTTGGWTARGRTRDFCRSIELDVLPEYTSARIK